MFESMKKDKVKMITLLGMAVMVIAVAVKAATSSVIAAAAIHVAGLACFFIIESIEKTPDSESGLSFKRFFPDLKTFHACINPRPNASEQGRVRQRLCRACAGAVRRAGP